MTNLGYILVYIKSLFESYNYFNLQAIFEALEDTIYHLRHQLREKESTIESLQGGISDQKETLESLYTFLR